MRIELTRTTFSNGPAQEARKKGKKREGWLCGERGDGGCEYVRSVGDVRDENIGIRRVVEEVNCISCFVGSEPLLQTGEVFFRR